MKIVIDIPDEKYKVIQDDYYCGILDNDMYYAIKGGTPLPKGHGDFVDAVPARLGVWLDKKITIKKAHGMAYGRWSCSACKAKQPYRSNFCPNCGADMRREGDEER